MRSKQLIANALRELALEKDYGKISIKDIVERADVGRATFYAHFEDKNDLNRFIVTQRFMGQVEIKLEAIANEPTINEPTINESTINESTIQNYTHQTLIPSLALFRVAEENYDLLKKYATSSDVGIDSLNQPLIARFEDKLRAMTITETHWGIPLRQVSIYLIHALTSLLTQWILDDMPSPPEAMDTTYQTLAYPTLEELLNNAKERTRWLQQKH